jgi:RNA polymerase sigma-70 factor (ECF subfamily)
VPLKVKKLLVDQTDYELLQKSAQGDMRAYCALVKRHLVRGVKVAERILGNRQDAEDVMQEACLKIWKESSRWKPQAKFSTWLYRVVINACLDKKRRVIHMMTDELGDILDDHPLAEELMIEQQQSRIIQAALQKLPGRQRAAVILNYYEGLGNQEAADSMGVALGAYQQLLVRAKQNLRDFLVGEKDEAAKTGS